MSLPLLEPSTSPCSPYPCLCHATALREACGHKVTTRALSEAPTGDNAPVGRVLLDF